MYFTFFTVCILLISHLCFAQFHKPSVNLFKQQTKAIQNALQPDCTEILSGDSTNAFTQNINHPCLNPANAKPSP
jgi:hypothetical protein